MDTNGIKRDDKGRIISGSAAINPGGRKSNHKLSDYIKKRYGEDLEILIDKLDDILNDKRTSAQVRVRIVEFLFDRVFGKPIQRNEIGGLDIVIGLPKDLETNEY